MTIKKYSLGSSGYHADPLPSKIDKCQMGSVGTRRKRNSQKKPSLRNQPTQNRNFIKLFPHTPPSSSPPGILHKSEHNGVQGKASGTSILCLPQIPIPPSTPPSLPVLRESFPNLSTMQSSQGARRGVDGRCWRGSVLVDEQYIQILIYKYKHKDANTKANTNSKARGDTMC